MIKTIEWSSKFHHSDHRNTICPAPLVLDDKLFIFFGIQDKRGEPAKLSVINISNNFQIHFMEIVILEEHIGSLGNLPNSIFIGSDGVIRLICAEFANSQEHKHRLLVHFHEIEILKDRVVIAERQDFDFIEYDSDEFHTVAGMSFYEGEFLFAKGKDWSLSEGNSVPLTKLVKRNTRLGNEVNIQVPEKIGDLAYARPILVNFESDRLFAFSVRSVGGGYGSRIYNFSDSNFQEISQHFILSGELRQEEELAYLYPFIWRDHLFSVVTQDFRGSKGFEIMESSVMN